MIINFRKLKKLEPEFKLSPIDEALNNARCLLGLHVKRYDYKDEFDNWAPRTQSEIDDIPATKTKEANARLVKYIETHVDRPKQNALKRMLREEKICSLYKELLTIKDPNFKPFKFKHTYTFDGTSQKLFSDEFIYALAEHLNIEIPAAKEEKPKTEPFVVQERPKTYSTSNTNVCVSPTEDTTTNVSETYTTNLESSNAFFTNCTNGFKFDCANKKSTAEDSVEFKAALAKSMVEPIRKSLEYQGIGRKLLNFDESPISGTLENYQRDVKAYQARLDQEKDPASKNLSPENEAILKNLITQLYDKGVISTRTLMEHLGQIANGEIVDGRIARTTL